ncbi:Conjugal transfer protein TraD [Roseomonas rosea]|uniref:Conjugal transfer protein TraD n=1 Tax=Muricoccus roseus TaxID=198092 RepID=A0A1M6SNY3_9PROT|nr:conjugal transfer protein TraD [Roseomonas rosea]SHK46454.1 Conjugal transfer protein TraD [Roseomonas rosea]
MARKPRDYDTELQALMERAKKLKGQKTTQLGELVQVTGADALPVEALAGALLAAVEQSRKQPDAVARWTERGEAFFRDGAKRGGARKKGAGPGDAAGGAAPARPRAPAAGGGA